MYHPKSNCFILNYLFPILSPATDLSLCFPSQKMSSKEIFLFSVNAFTCFSQELLPVLFTPHPGLLAVWAQMSRWVLNPVTHPPTHVSTTSFLKRFIWIAGHHSLVSFHFSSYVFAVVLIFIYLFLIFPTSTHQDSCGGVQIPLLPLCGLS